MVIGDGGNDVAGEAAAGRGGVVDVPQPLTAAAQRRERLRDETRQAILDATQEIIEREGIDGFSLRGVARAVGYSPAAIYEYFGSKHELLDSLYFAGNGGLAVQMLRVLKAAPPDQPVAETVKDLGRTYRRQALAQPELYRFIFGHVHGPDHRKGNDKRACDEKGEPGDAFSLLVDTVARGIDRGEFIAAPPLVLALATWSLVHGFVTIELAGVLDSGDPPARHVRAGDEATGSADDPDHDDLFEGTLQIMGLGLLSRPDPVSPADAARVDRVDI